MPSKDLSRPTELLVVVLWIGWYFGARAALSATPPVEWARVCVALSPLLPTFAAMWCARRALRGLDELEKRVQLEALAFAFMMAIALLWVLGLLELAVTLDPSNWSYRHVWAMLPLFYFVGLALAWRRYK